MSYGMKPLIRPAMISQSGTTGDPVTTFLDLANLNLPVELIVNVGTITGDDTVVTVDESTGQITLRAAVPNDQNILMPGLYVRVLLDGYFDQPGAWNSNAATARALAAIGHAETRRTRSVLEACGARIDRRERDRSLRDAARRLLERYRTPSPGDRGSIHIIGDGRAAHPDRERAQLLLARHPGARPWSVAPGPANVGPGTPWEPVEAASPDAFDGGYLVLLPGSDPLGPWFESIAPRAIVVAHPPEDAEGIVRRLAQIDTYRLACAVEVWPLSPRAAGRDAGARPSPVRAQA